MGASGIFKHGFHEGFNCCERVSNIRVVAIELVSETIDSLSRQNFSSRFYLVATVVGNWQHCHNSCDYMKTRLQFLVRLMFPRTTQAESIFLRKVSTLKTYPFITEPT